jgi:hypothetical protein
MNSDSDPIGSVRAREANGQLENLLVVEAEQQIGTYRSVVKGRSTTITFAKVARKTLNLFLGRNTPERAQLQEYIKKYVIINTSISGNDKLFEEDFELPFSKSDYYLDTWTAVGNYVFKFKEDFDNPSVVPEFIKKEFEKHNVWYEKAKGLGVKNIELAPLILFSMTELIKGGAVNVQNEFLNSFYKKLRIKMSHERNRYRDQLIKDFASYRKVSNAIKLIEFKVENIYKNKENREKLIEYVSKAYDRYLNYYDKEIQISLNDMEAPEGLNKREKRYLGLYKKWFEITVAHSLNTRKTEGRSHVYYPTAEAMETIEGNSIANPVYMSPADVHGVKSEDNVSQVKRFIETNTQESAGEIRRYISMYNIEGINQDSTTQEIAEAVYYGSNFFSTSQMFIDWDANNKATKLTTSGPFYSALSSFAKKNGIKLTFERPSWSTAMLIKADITNYNPTGAARFSKLEDDHKNVDKLLKFLQDKNLVTKNKYNGRFWVKASTEDTITGKIIQLDTELNVDKLNIINQWYLEKYGYKPIRIVKKGIGYVVYIDFPTEIFQEAPKNNIVLSELATKFGVAYKIVTREEITEILTRNNKGTILAGKNLPKAFFYQGVVYFMEGTVTEATAIEEFLHPFVNAIFTSNKDLFDNLLYEVIVHEADIVNSVQKAYTDARGFDSTDRNLEMVTKALTKYYHAEIKSNNYQETPQSRLLGWLRIAFLYIKDLINDLVGGRVFAESIPANMTYGDIARILNIQGIRFESVTLGDKIQFALSDKQKEIADSFKRMGAEHQTLINANKTKNKLDRDYVTVTDLVGGTFSGVEKDIYEMFTTLGTDLHKIVEDVAAGKVKASDAIMSFSATNTIASNLKGHSHQFVDNTTAIDIFTSIVNLVSSLAARNNLLIPEAKVIGVAKDGRKIIGRLDLLIVAPDGSMSIYDFKAKKVYDVQDNNQFWGYRAGVDPVKYPQADPEFRSASYTRSTAEQWALQLAMYHHMLASKGFNVTNSDIIPFLYTTNRESDKMTSFKLYTEPVPVSNKRATDWANKYFEVPVIIEETKNIENFLTEEQFTSFVENLKQRVSKAITDVQELIKKSQDDKLALEKLKDQKQSLRGLQQTLDGMTQNDIKFTSIIQYLRDAVERYHSQADSIFRAEGDINEKSDSVSRINGVVIGLQQILDIVETVAVDNGVSQTSEFFSYTSRIRQSIKHIEDIYNLLGQQVLIKQMAEVYPEESKTKMNSSIRETLLADKARLEKTLTGEHKIGALGKMVGRANAPYIRKKLLEIEAKLAQIPVDDATIKDIIKASETGFHMGKKTPMSRFYASVSSSDFMLSNFTKYLKNKFYTARIAFQESLQLSGLQKKFDNYKKGKTHNEVALSEPITEVVTKKIFTEEGIEEKQQFQLISPVTSEYENIFTEYRQNLHDLRAKKRAAPESEKRAISQEIGQLIKNHNLWLKNNAQRYYKDRVYEIDEKLTPATVEWMDDWRDRRNSILVRLDRNKEESWSESDLEALDMLHREYQEARSVLDVKGNKKTGAPLEIAESLKAFHKEITEIYDFEVNNRYFEIMLNAKKVLLRDGKMTQNEFNDWYKRNTVRKIKPEFWEEFNRVMEQISAILGDKSGFKIFTDGEEITIEEANKRINALKLYRRDDDGEVNPEDFYPEAINKINEIQDAIDDASKSNFTFLGEDEADLLKSLFKKLASLGSRQWTKYYSERIDEFSRTVDSAWSDYKKGMLTIEEFRAIERPFAEWFSENHENAYISKELRDNTPIAKEPKKIWTQFKPSEDRWYYDAPSSKYVIRRVKEEHINKDYQEFLNGIPLPKFLREDDNKYTVLSDSPYLNISYKGLRGDDKDFYDTIRTYYFGLQKKTTRRNLGFVIPGYYRETMEAFAQEGLFKGAYTIFREKKQKLLSTQESEELTGYNLNTDYVRLKGNRVLDIQDQSRDAIGSILKWAAEAHINVEMAKVANSSKSAVDYLRSELRKVEQAEGKQSARVKDMERVVSQLDEEWRKFIKGEFSDQSSNEWLDKVVDGALGFAGTVRMIANLPNHIINLLSGNIQNVIIATEKDLSIRDIGWANYTLLEKVMPSIYADLSKMGDKGMWTQLYEKYNPLEKAPEEFFQNSVLTRARKIYEEGGLNMIKDKGETQIAITVWLAMMRRKQVYLQDGTPISLSEAYEMRDGVARLREDVKFAKEDEIEFINNVQSVIRKAQGNYAQIDSTSISRHAWGRAAEFFKKYFLPLFRNRFSDYQASYEEHKVLKGFYRTFVGNLLDYGITETFKSLFTSNTSIDQFRRMANIKAAREFSIGSGLLIIGIMLKAIADGGDDDDVVQNAVLYNLSYIFGRSGFETNQFDPLPFFGGLDNYTQTFNSFSVSIKTLVAPVTAITAGTALGLATIFPDWEWVDKKAFYQKDSGYFDEGDWKIKKPLYELTGFANIMSMMYPKQNADRIFR